MLSLPLHLPQRIRFCVVIVPVERCPKLVDGHPGSELQKDTVTESEALMRTREPFEKRE